MNDKEVIRQLQQDVELAKKQIQELTNQNIEFLGLFQKKDKIMDGVIKILDRLTTP
jgi:hypothetical protein